MLLSLACALVAQASLATPPPTLNADQLVVVTTASWTSTSGRLQRYEKKDSRWVAVGSSVDVVVGESGLGWGLGLQDVTSGAGEPRKMEGDGRAPAGVFRLRGVLGKGGVPQTKMPKHTTDAGDVCVDDVTSAVYNRVVYAAPASDPPADPAAEKAWKSAEPMLRKDALYDLVVTVDHNATGALPGAAAAAGDDIVKPIKGRGSCVFLHVWRRPSSPTIGCTAMALTNLADVVVWLDPDREPLLVQLPRDIYARNREAWALP